MCDAGQPGVACLGHGSHTFSNTKFKDFSRTFKDFSIFVKDIFVQVKKLACGLQKSGQKV